MNELIIQITAGRGPAECARAAFKILELLKADAVKSSIEIEIMSLQKGEKNGTILSASMAAKGESLQEFVKEWTGTVQWIGQSPYRKFHKRKNWFTGIEVFNVQPAPEWNEKDLVFQTCRSSGPGGQHVNKVETAVKGTHIPTGIQVTVMDSRSQFQNKQLCIQRLKQKVLSQAAKDIAGEQQYQWEAHTSLQRGGAVKIIRGEL